MSTEEQQLACFDVGTETYGINIVHIKEILLYRTITAVPRAPEFMEGILNLRGRVIPIIDMRKRLGIPPQPDGPTRATRIIIVVVGARDVGIIVDRVDKVIKLGDADIDPSPDVATGVGPEYLEGVARDGEEMVMVLNMEKVLSSKDRVRLDDINNVMAQEAAKVSETPAKVSETPTKEEA